nr:retrovirus-related Pol polyprotein from transposon TNT 1-94 [Tanacetum cinerariifolium]
VFPLLFVFSGVRVNDQLQGEEESGHNYLSHLPAKHRMRQKEPIVGKIKGKKKQKQSPSNVTVNRNDDTEFKLEGDNTPIGIQPPCYSASKNFQDSPGDEEDTRSSQEYMDDLEEEYQERDFLAKSKRFFKKGTQRFSSAKASDQTKCHKCSKKGHFARDCFLKTLAPSYQSPFQPKLLSFSHHKPEQRPTKDFEAKYNKVKAKMALLSSSALASKASIVKNKGLIVEAYEWDEEEMSSDDNVMVEVKKRRCQEW